MLGVVPMAALAGSESDEVLAGYEAKLRPWFIGTGAIAAAGAVTALAGVTVLLVYNRKMSAICDKFNESHGYYSFTLSPYGVGLKVKF